MAEPRHGRGPIIVDETAGKKSYCQCGLSARLPYCDGTHARENTGLRPITVEITEPCKRAVCQCHQSEDKPWCDGTHATL